MNVDLDNQSISSCLSCFAHSWFCNVVILLCNLQFFSVVSYFTIHCKERQSNDPNDGHSHRKCANKKLRKVKNCYEIFADFDLMICKQKGKKVWKHKKANFTIHCKERKSNDPNDGHNHSKFHIALMICKQKVQKR